MKKYQRFLGRYANLLLLALLCLVAAAFSSSFFSARNLSNILKQSCILGVLTIGLSNILISGHMDLSIGAQVSFTGLLVIALQKELPVGLAILAALLAGCFLGMLNGLVVVLFHANSGGSLMITYGTGLLFSAMSLIYTQGFTLEGSDSAFYEQIGIGTLPIGSVGRYISYSMVIFVLLALLLGVLEGRTIFGRAIHMTGYNEECTRLSGIKPSRHILASYMIMGVMSAVAAILLTSRVSGANPTAGDGYEMDAIIAAVLGGISLAGGKGSVPRAVLGVITFQVLSNAMNLIGFGTYDQTIVKGVVLILAIAFDTWNRKQLGKA
ncbi:MAG: ABC transporter permease [Lachnospiraceae bacterium]|jgi:ribose transport system permease protein|nr:ABC transporter permease [Lachnospiraceae bacterium]MCI9134816.1 ABC transporter permease [Lachnospiraceae bacterium]